MQGQLEAIASATSVGAIAIIKSAGSPMIWPDMRFPLQLPVSDCESVYPCFLLFA